ncbi:Aste57867_25480 [Aphanomyces stellatus]|uniref:Kinesin-like protein n=1 Tax=Aphanomyces stellatus TaxID=120398 RepID=A0A485LU78_9STRA|nr:hypothetical protein As57867_025401 [Aphanomyces stellatus]VFU02103.1 Aste57867_25480 [Aphanomyces stellatus]
MATAASSERVRVFCRLRPYVEHADAQPEDDEVDKETFVTGATSAAAGRRLAVQARGDNGVLVHADADTTAKEFAFDGCFRDDCDQESVYNTSARDLVQSVLDGYNATIMAYGQTGSGKTHTMLGKAMDGIIPRCLRDLVSLRPSTLSTARVVLKASYVQVYCERVYDLLEPLTLPNALQIRESDERGVFVDGVALAPVSSIQECLALMDRGNANRTVASTNMNAHSSRSHAIFTMHVETTDVMDGHEVIQISQLNLVDLAGSERVKKSLVRGSHVNELKAINLSLSALGNCISALSKAQAHVPYRDSKLTRLLQHSLGGNAKTSLILTVNPDMTEASESLATLQFGQRAMQVTVQARVHVVPDYKRLADALQTKLDLQMDRVNELDMELHATRQSEATLANQVEDLRVAHAQAMFELHATKATHGPVVPALPSSSVDATSSSTNDPPSSAIDVVAAIEARVADLVHQHTVELNQLKHRYDQQVAAHKQVANRANQEWHNVEHELSAERTAHLATLQDVRDAKEKLWALDAASTERLSELSAEKKELEAQVAASLKHIQALDAARRTLDDKVQALEAGKGQLESSLDTNYVSRAQVREMEALYADAIAKLQHRVESLETTNVQKKSSAAAAAALTSMVALPPVKDPLAKRTVVQDTLVPKKAVAKVGRVMPAGRR